MDKPLVALAITTLAGLFTGLGAMINVVLKKLNYRFLSVVAGFSAGVMIYLCFVEIIPESIEILTKNYTYPKARLINTLAFFGGILIMAIIDILVPGSENPHETRSLEELKGIYNETSPNSVKLLRTGIFMSIALIIHNLPEGLATFLSLLENVEWGMAIAVAVALHNIPEGISISVPIFYALGSRKKAIAYAFISGMAEPIGASLGYVIITSFAGFSLTAPVSKEVMAILLSGVGGVMVYISLDELIPISRAYSKSHESLVGLITGMLIMEISLFLIKR